MVEIDPFSYKLRSYRILYQVQNSSRWEKSQAEDDISEEENVSDTEINANNGEKNGHENKLLTTNFEVEVEKGKSEGLITYSTDQQIFKFKVNSGTDQQVWGVYIDFQSIHSKWTIDVILQHMGFYVKYTIYNCMSRWILCQDGLYIVSTTPEEILHMLKDKYKINIYLQDKYPHDPGGRDIYKYQVKEYLEN